MKKSPDKNSYHHGDLKKALLEASLRILKDEGYKSLSLRKAATYAGVSQSAPYRHYEDLESLYADIAEEGFKMLAERQKKLQVKYRTKPLLLFRESGVCYVEFALEFPDLFRIMYGNQIESHSKYKSLVKTEDESFRIIVEIIRDCQRAGVIRTDDVVSSATSAWTMVHGIAVLLAGKQVMFRSVDLKEARRITKELIHYLYIGMKSDETSSKRSY
ncbi:TetR/AcrR family transcriptional regulator [Leptospira kirschneri]|uniref:WHG domain protein n=2 Tax=Leptospira kirschneri TaxID=29507 RepID=A0A0E2B024_9LEPT|nr:TetR/AcrR family transcriptional regulator [Leptospira kirschneri]EKO14114.1 WHG domain protein [Leptospira kirschneri str. H1]EKO62731.1 WHG domain protein [Leptospira kirschneri str. H2]EMK21656.1 WHG domain protein [Leptospira kirschneri serovar Bulgarica str. Nikolaevo]UML79764.1 TetR/AcrR family transcriptional regulator [Leptospira kirschneri]